MTPFFCVLAEEDFSDSDSVMTGVDSPELAETSADKDNLRCVYLKLKSLNILYQQ